MNGKLAPETIMFSFDQEATFNLNMKVKIIDEICEI